jgi:hypothetical protein
MKKVEFLLEVKAELDNIKAKATKEELSNLNIDRFNHNRNSRCIYGQMTGDCDSRRAMELAPKIYHRLGDGDKHGFAKQDFQKREGLNQNYYTALEKYLFMVKKPTHSKIIDYLTGKINNIQLR